MYELLEYLSEPARAILVLFLLIGVGAAIGHIKIKGVSLGAAAVLFCAIGLAAAAHASGLELRIPEQLGTLGLAMFTFTVGVTSGANFFASLERGWKLMLSMAAVLAGAAGLAVGVGRVLGLDGATIGGTFAGAVTNTPSLGQVIAATQGSGLPDPTVGYAVAYVYGVAGMLVFATLALRHASQDTDAPAELINRTVRVESRKPLSLIGLETRYKGQIKFSRIRHGEDNPIYTPTIDDVLRHNDLVTVVGPAGLVDEVTSLLGHKSSHSLQRDREYLDYRRITVSDPRRAGRSLGQLGLEDRFGATVSRVRRGDVDMVANADLMLQEGDRVRVIAPRDQILGVTKFFGDSTKGLSDLSPITFGLGMAAGIIVGSWVIPGVGFALGAAAGTLIVGLIFGRAGRIGPLTTTMPVSAAQVITELGLLMFLAQAGTNAGNQIAVAFTGGSWWRILVLGIAITTFVGLGLYLVMRQAFKVGGTQLSGILGGAQTQPAVLAYANGRTGTDSRVALGYALVYPAAMITKILIGQILGMIA